MLLLAWTHARAAGVNADGATLYLTTCASCHGSIGRGSSLAPALIGKPAVDIHFMLDTGRMPASAPGINEVHRQSAFTEKQIDDITTYVETLSNEAGLHADASLPIIVPGDIVRGNKLFAENCAVCHGAAGDGASVGQDNVAPSLMNATVFQVAEAIRTGPSIMPRFSRRVLSDQDVSDIARYVNYLQTQAGGPALDPGGFSLAHTGPIAEGAIAWIFGLGILVLIVRLLGTTE